jgi:hypothetical protein
VIAYLTLDTNMVSAVRCCLPEEPHELHTQVAWQLLNALCLSPHCIATKHITVLLNLYAHSSGSSAAVARNGKHLTAVVYCYCVLLMQRCHAVNETQHAAAMCIAEPRSAIGAYVYSYHHSVSDDKCHYKTSVQMLHTAKVLHYCK